VLTWPHSGCERVFSWNILVYMLTSQILWVFELFVPMSWSGPRSWIHIFSLHLSHIDPRQDEILRPYCNSWPFFHLAFPVLLFPSSIFSSPVLWGCCVKPKGIHTLLQSFNWIKTSPTPFKTTCTMVYSLTV